MTADRWADLAAAVKARRERLGMPQDLQSRGGPGDITVRKLERAEVTSIRPGTVRRLETGLSWPPGTVACLLDGTMTVDAAVTATAPTAPAAPKPPDAVGAIMARYRAAADAPRKPLSEAILDDGAMRREDLSLISLVIDRLSGSTEPGIRTWAKDGERLLGQLILDAMHMRDKGHPRGPHCCCGPPACAAS